MRKYLLPAAGLVALVALIIAGIILTNTPSTSADLSEAAARLRRTPGLRTDADGAIEDEIISAWEAWKLDQQVSDCMRRHGFTWLPESLITEQTAAGIAERLGLDLQPAPSEKIRSSADRNFDAIPSDQQGRAAYYLALYGFTEEAKVAEELNSPTEPEFAGCKGEAEAQPGIRKAVSPILDAYQKYLIKADTNPLVIRAREDLASCTAGAIGFGIRSQRQLSELSRPDLAQAAEQACGAQLEELARATTQVADALAYQEFTELCDAQARTYRDAINRIREDQRFLDFLRSEALALLAD